jgi:hypothetical protein
MSDSEREKSLIGNTSDCEIVYDYSIVVSRMSTHERMLKSRGGSEGCNVRLRNTLLSYHPHIKSIRCQRSPLQ